VSPPPSSVVTNISKLKVVDYTFFTLNQSAYNSSSPIPVDVKAPQGIYFMVQVGAFKNPIPQNLFKGITPITGETTAEGLIRYSAGMFKTFESCNYAKNLIREMGYGDAFVVAYIDGKRVSLRDALEKLSKLEGQEQLTYKQSEQLELAQLKELKLPIATASEQEIKNAMANANDISKTIGLIYTVQIGVYSNPVTPDKLFNVAPISYLKTSSGYIRYSTGQFKKFGDADIRKKEVVGIGIKDAFVTAYYNGDRITIADAAAIARGEKPDLPASSDNTLAATQHSEPGTHNSQAATDNSITFRVQMGAFKGDVAVKMVNIFLQFNSYGVEQLKNDNGYTIYVAGAFPDLASASALKDKIVKAGIADAFVIAFNNGKRIAISAATELLTKK
jgi:cell division septation protein DedD